MEEGILRVLLCDAQQPQTHTNTYTNTRLGLYDVDAAVVIYEAGDYAI